MRLKVMHGLHIFYVFVAGSIMIICIQSNHKVRAGADGASRFFFVKLGWCPPQDKEQHTVINGVG